MIVLLRKEPTLTGPDLAIMTDQSSSRLLSLPPELRNTIWNLLLVHDLENEARIPSNSLPATADALRRERVCANVLRTCKQANKEGTPILFGDNTFLAHSSLLAALPAFLLRTTPTRVSMPPVKWPRVANMIRRYYIHVRLDTDPRFTRLQVEESFTGVEELEIEVFQAMYGSCDFSVLELFDGVRGVGKAVVQGSVGDGKYAGWLAQSMMTAAGAAVPAYSEEYIGGSKVWHAWVHGNR